MTEETKTKELAVTNYAKIQAMAKDPKTIERFLEVMGSKPEAMGYINSAMLAVANAPGLQDCTPHSVFNSVLRAASLRLYCDPALRQAHLVPFKNKKTQTVICTLILGYIGIQNLALRTNQYSICNAGRLYEGQSMETDQLTGLSVIQGKPTGKGIIGYFHYFKLNSGFTHVLYMTVEELRAHGDRYGHGNEMWTNRFDDMAMKTVTRLNLLKYGILDPHDRGIVASMEEEKDPDQEPIQENYIDAEFTEEDDIQAADLAYRAMVEKASRPKQTREEILADLGFEKPTKPTSVYPVHKEADANAPEFNDPDDVKEDWDKLDKIKAVQSIEAVTSNLTFEISEQIGYMGKPLGSFTDNQLMDLVTQEKDKKAANQKYNPMVLQAAGIILSHRLGQ